MNNLFAAATLPTTNPVASWQTIAFQGVPGAYAHIAAQQAAPHAQPVGCESFAAAIQMVESGQASGAILPVENSTMGRIADIHTLLPHTTLSIVAEHYLPIQHALLGLKGAEISQIRTVFSQSPAIQQCIKTLQNMGLAHKNYLDTAGSAKMVAERADPTLAALASPLAAQVYGLQVLQFPMNDHPSNTTRFLLLGPQGWSPPTETPTKTTLLFQVKDIPAALYKALGGFATNGLNLTRLESYLLGGDFKAADFFIDIEGHPSTPAMHNALEELTHFTTHIHHMGTYPLKE